MKRFRNHTYGIVERVNAFVSVDMAVWRRHLDLPQMRLQWFGHGKHKEVASAVCSTYRGEKVWVFRCAIIEGNANIVCGEIPGIVWRSFYKSNILLILFWKKQTPFCLFWTDERRTKKRNKTSLLLCWNDRAKNPVNLCSIEVRYVGNIVLGWPGSYKKIVISILLNYSFLYISETSFFWKGNILPFILLNFCNCSKR